MRQGYDDSSTGYSPRDAEAAATATDPHPVPATDGGRRPLSRQAHRRRPRRGRGRRLPRRPREAARGHRPQGRRRAQLARVRAARDRRAPQRRALGGRASSSTRPVAGTGRSRPGPTIFATWRDELRRKLEAGQHDLAGELSARASCCSTDAAARAKGADKKLIEHALRVLRDDEILEAAKHDAALGQELYAAIERNAERHGATRLEPGLALEVDRVRGALRLLVRAVPALVRAG